jgi:hypothetical protein
MIKFSIYLRSTFPLGLLLLLDSLIWITSLQLFLMSEGSLYLLNDVPLYNEIINYIFHILVLGKLSGIFKPEMLITDSVELSTTREATSCAAIR